MAKKKKKKNNAVGAILAIIILLGLAIFENDAQLLNSVETDTSSNTVSSENTTSESIDALENVTITTGNDCITEIQQDDSLRVYCFDVGQGDSILIVNNQKTMLIDASTNEMGSTVVEYLQKLGISKIDYLVGTHPHEDHIGGLDDVIENFDIGTIYMPKVTASTKTYEDVIDAISEKNLKVTTPAVGDTFSVGDANCEIMAIGNDSSDYNACSIVIQMDFNGTTYLFTGDAEESVESSRTWSDVDILKVGHHGSSTSSSQSFLEQIQPKVALISVGEGNSYGHPTQETLDRLTSIGASVYRTDEDETILVLQKNA